MSRSAGWAIILVSAALFLSLSATFNHAQEKPLPGANSNLAVVNLALVFDNFEQTTALNQMMKERRLKLQQEAEKKDQDLLNAKAALDAFTPGSADWHKRDQEYRKMFFEAQVWQALEKERIVQDHLSWLKRTYQIVNEEIASVAKARGIQLVITREDLKTDVPTAEAMLQQILNRKVIYSDANIDLSEEVLRNLNAAFEKAGGAESLNFTQ